MAIFTKTPLTTPQNLNTPIQFDKNKNFLVPTRFKIIIDRTRYSNVEYTITSVSLPDINVSSASYSTASARIGMPGDKIDYSPLSLTFIIDETLENYREIYEWMLGLVEINDSTNDGKTRDIRLLIYSSKENPLMEFQFVDAYPTSLSGVEFDSSDQSSAYLKATVTFDYSYFKLIKT